MSFCEDIHKELWDSYCFMAKGEKPPLDWGKIPESGLYFLFEKGESIYGGDRIVRVGTHTIKSGNYDGKNVLQRRLEQHFYVMNKNGSIFRKHIGRCLLVQRQEESFLPIWNDKKTSKNTSKKVAELEKDVSNYLKENFCFVVREVNAKDDRKKTETDILSTLAEAFLSKCWLGKFHPDPRIQKNGLWNIQGTNRAKSEIDHARIMEILRNGRI